ncbi:MAG: HD domain-containing protein [Bacilli bacterium]
MDTPQNILNDTEGSVYKHTYLATQYMIDYINRVKDPKYKDTDYRDILVYSVLLHDIGKPKATKVGDDGLYHCMYHATIGEDIASIFLKRYASEIIGYKKKVILQLVRYHMHPSYIFKRQNPSKLLLSLVNNLEIDFEALLLLKKCDWKGTMVKNPRNYKKILKKAQELYYSVCSYPSGTNVILKKIKDITGNIYPKNINIGDTFKGILTHPITKGMRTSLGFRFSTSPVDKIIDKTHFQTQNSIYEIIKIK